MKTTPWSKVFVYYGDCTENIRSILDSINCAEAYIKEGGATAQFGVLTVFASDMETVEQSLDKVIPEWRNLSWWSTEDDNTKNKHLQVLCRTSPDLCRGVAPSLFK